MVSYFVRYRGAADDPAAFLAYYRRRHAGVLQGLPDIRSLVLHTPAKVQDPFATSPGGSCLLAQLVFDNAAALIAALQSQARAEAREDFARFPPFRGEVTHEALSAEVIF